MAIDTNIQTFTDAELLALTRKAIAELLAYGSSVGSNGKSLTRVDLPALMEAQRTLEDRISTADASATGNGGGIALVKFGDAQ